MGGGEGCFEWLNEQFNMCCKLVRVPFRDAVGGKWEAFYVKQERCELQGPQQRSGSSAEYEISDLKLALHNTEDCSARGQVSVNERNAYSFCSYSVKHLETLGLVITEDQCD
ncbi:hypothetical protein NDU88_003334 [Pleurodeles waltl]|uniref:Uncharacterized protein n=1 Tax=Pleurodeles waltl TaxID=8319 RepID=A0AAV7W4G3_PLEWA|nr:hypothetical protein NDU88_003334 [Pleurodeles waltl]